MAQQFRNGSGPSIDERRRLANAMRNGPLDLLRSPAVYVGATRVVLAGGGATQADRTLRRLGVALDSEAQRIEAVISEIVGLPAAAKETAGQPSHRAHHHHRTKVPATITG